MTVTDQIKILGRKIMQNEAEYDLDRKAVKISALSCNNLDKYEYLTGEDLSLKPSTVEQAKFEYFPLGKVFTKGLDKKDSLKEGLFKRLKNIEAENEALLKAIEDQRKKQVYAIKNISISSKPLKTISFFSTTSEEAKKLMEKIKTIDDSLDSARLICTKTDRRTKYDFSNFMFPLKFASKIYRGDLTLQKAKDDQVNVKILINKLNNDCNPQNQEKMKEKDNTLKSAKKLLLVRDEIIKAFETLLKHHRRKIR